MTFEVHYTAHARADLLRLYAHLLDRAVTTDDLSRADAAREAITSAVALLAHHPFTCRKAGRDPFVRELIIPFGGSGYVALFEVVDARSVWVLALRHQLEDDYH